MNNNLFQSLPIVAHAVGQQCGIRVEVGGTNAYTDGQTVHLPYPKDFDEDVLLGFLVHEASHVRFTDFSFLPTIETPVIKHLYNIYEDTRIERQINGVYRGANAILKKTLKHVFGNEYEVADETTPLSLLMDYVAYNVWDRYRFAGDILTPHAQTTLTLAQKCFPVDLLNNLEAINDRIALAQTSHDCLAMAEDAFDLMKDFFKAQPEAMQSPDGQSSPSGESDEKSSAKDTNKGSYSTKANDASNAPSQKESGNQDASGGQNQSASTSSSHPSSNTTPQDGSNPQEGSNPQQGQGQGAGAQGQTSPQKAESKPSAKAVKEAIKALESFEDDSKDISKTLAKAIDEQAQKEGVHPTEEAHCATKSPATDREELESVDFLNDCRALSQGLKRQLAGLVAQAARTKTMTRHAGRKIAVHKLSRLVAGNTRVFQKRVEHESTASAVHILLDMSGSMYDSAEVAAKAATGLWMALASLPKTNPALSIFPARSERSYTEVILGHGEKLARGTSGRFSRISACGGTPLAEALGDVVKELATTKEKRRIVIVITDGEPDNRLGTKRFIEKMATSGIDLYGIGIGYDVSHLFSQSVMIEDVHELSKVLFDLAKHTSLLAVN